MALLFIDGFDHYDEIRLKWTVSNTFDNPDFVQGRFGGQALQKQFQNAGGSIQQNFGKQTEVIVGFALYTGDDSIGYVINNQNEADPVRTKKFPNDDLLTFKDESNSIILTIRLIPIGTTGQGLLEVNYPGPALNPTIDTLTANLWSTEQWRYIQVRYNPNHTGGIIEIADGANVIIYRAEGRTTERGDNDVASITIMGDSTNSPAYRIDDLYIINREGADNNFYLKDIRVTPFEVRAITSANSTSNTAPAVAAVQDTIMDDATFVRMGVIGFEDKYEMQDFICHGFTPKGDVVSGVQINIATAKDNTGIIKYQHVVNTVTGSDITPNTFATAALLSGFGIDKTIYDVDPNGGGTWTQAKIDALEVGFKLTVREGGA